MPLNKLVLRIRNICCSTTNLHLQVYVVPNSRKAEEFFFFLIREISLKSAKRNQVHRKYTRKASRKKKKTIQGNH
jgi:hypothetical protein